MAAAIAWRIAAGSKPRRCLALARAPACRRGRGLDVGQRDRALGPLPSKPANVDAELRRPARASG